MARYDKLKVKGPDFEAGRSTDPKPLPTNLLARALTLVITGVFKVVGGDGSGTLHPDAVWRILRALEISGDNATPIRAVAAVFRVIEKFWTRIPGTQVGPVSLAAGVAQPLEVRIPIPFYMPWSNAPDTCSLALYDTSEPAIQIQCGAASELCYGLAAGAVPTFENMRVEMEFQTTDGGPLGRDGQMYGLMMMAFKELILQDSGTDQTLDLNLDMSEILAVIVETLDHGVAGSNFRHTDAMITELSLAVNGVTARSPISWNSLREENKTDYGLNAREPGVAVFHAAQDRLTGPGELWPVGLTKPVIKFNAKHTGNGVNKIRVTVIGVARGL